MSKDENEDECSIYALKWQIVYDVHLFSSAGKLT